MKVFIAGTRSIKYLPLPVTKELDTIMKDGGEILVGDCYGVDTAVQEYCRKAGYRNVTVYASNGRARNNLGGFPVKAVPVSGAVSGFEFYRQKDIAMARDADCGLMVWDGSSRGTGSNIRTLLDMGKNAMVWNQRTRSLEWSREGA